MLMFGLVDQLWISGAGVDSEVFVATSPCGLPEGPCRITKNSISANPAREYCVLRHDHHCIQRESTGVRLSSVDIKDGLKGGWLKAVEPCLERHETQPQGY